LGDAILLGAVRAFIASFVVAATCIGDANASPWNRSAKHAFTAATAGFFRSSTPTSRYSRIDSDNYVEYGLTRRWMAAGKLVYSTAITQTPDFSTTRSTIGEANFQIQRQVFHKEHSAAAMQIAGLWSSSLEDGSRAGALSSNWGGEIRALYGRDIVLKPFKIFSTIEAGYQRRFGGDSDRVRIDGLIGIEPGRWLFLVELQSTISVRNNEFGFQDFDLVIGQTSIVWSASKRWSFIVGARKDLAARNYSPGTGVFVGVWSKF